MAELGFDGRVAIITGAGGGLGREHAMYLASRGAMVVINDIGGTVHGEGGDVGPAERAAKEIEAMGGVAVADTNSVATPEGGQAIVDTAVEAFGRVDIVINNAGILRDKSFHNLTPDLVDPVIDGQLDMRYLRLLLGMAQQAHVVVCTASWEAAALDEVLLLGVRGFLPKLPEPMPDLCDELAVAGAGQVVVLAVSIVEAMRTEFVATRLLGPQVPVPALDPLERRVLHGLVSGQSTKAIAAALSAEGTRVSARTVQRISERVQHRLGVHTICQLGAEAVRRGIV